MTTWTDVMSAKELAEGQHTLIVLEGIELLLVNIDNQYYAVENACSHDGGDLSEGEISGREITCPRHGARFCLKTGEVLCAPAFEDIEAYPVRVVDGRIQVGI
ncbi:non-heme iron oxygenase ferredoxin subunit [Photobacterium sp. OFAV2-7]|uniref:Rieske (2Fe-2S) protein n=1 Tax=Photobacterium sp. OFAV2-7 TaxID=2917748 RepID=UPI001EF6F5E9|nr:non-heme iron oxygenase ferredoxin subunit [Photobacterium sp. OFAV2-7]MCG7585224.1 non-heme iron oxygenase ferredoxin subunit [Photobacterium sp. OFAV2-7]